MDNKRRRCSRCKKVKSLDEFYPEKTKGKTNRYCGVRSECKTCTRKATKRYMDEDLKRKRNRNWKDRGVNCTVTIYDEKFADQQGRCGICGRHQSEFEKALSIDHNHKTGKIRGLLCSQCNLALGYIESQVNFSSGVEKYLDFWGRKKKNAL